MANDNTLGAPTEGLGQNVTFVAGGGRVPQTSAGQRQALRTNSTGGGAVSTARAMQVPPAQPDATFAVLAKLGGDLLKPHLEAERNAAYVQGMQQAAQGQAIAEIVDEQPWYSKMFGSTSLVDGARAYTANTKATAMAIELETNMGELRKLSPGEFASQTTKKLTSASTGDATTDMMFQQQVGQILPSAFKTQAKEHLRYNAEVLGDGIEEAAYTNLKRVVVSDAAYRDPSRVNDGGELVAHELAAKDAFIPPEGMPQEEFLKRTANATIRAVNEGGHAAYQLVKTSGVYDKFSPTQQAALETAHMRARQRTIADLPLEFSQEMLDFARSNSDATSPEDIKARAEKGNAKYYQLTGDPYNIFDARSVASETDAWMRNQDAEVARSRKAMAAAGLPEQKAAAALAHVRDLAAIAQSGGYVGQALDGKKEKELFWGVLEKDLKDTKDGGAKLSLMRVSQADKENLDETYKDKLQGQILEAVRSKSPSLMRDAAAQYNQLVAVGGGRGDAIAQRYAGDGGKVIAEYTRLAGANPDAVGVEIAFSKAMTAADKVVPLNATAKKEVVKELTTNWTGISFDTLGSDKFPYRNPAGLADAVAGRLRADLEPSARAKVAVQDAVANGEIGLLGGYHWDMMPGQQRFDQGIEKAALAHRAANPTGVTHNSDEHNKAFVFSVNKAIEEQGIDSQVSVMQLADGEDGIPRVLVMGETGGGKPKFRILTPAEVVSNWVADKSKPSTFSSPKMVPGPAPKYGPHTMKQ